MRALVRVVAVGCALLLAAPPTARAGTPPPKHLDPAIRVAGDNRFQTAAALGRLADGDGDHAVLVPADAPLLAMVAAPLAAVREAPVLLVGRDTVPAATLQALRDHGTARVEVVGGEDVIGGAVLDELAEAGVEAVRVAGPDRAGTAAAVAELIGAPPEEVVFLVGADPADGDRGWPHALVAAALAARRAAPLLLTAPDGLPAATADALVRRSPARVVVVGTADLVAEQVLAQLAALDLPADRLDGPAERLAADIALAHARGGAADDLLGDLVADLPATGPVLVAAAGGGPADALALPALAARAEAPLVLVEGDDPDGGGYDALAVLGTGSGLVMAGGAGAATGEVTARIAAAAAVRFPVSTRHAERRSGGGDVVLLLSGVAALAAVRLRGARAGRAARTSGAARSG